MPPPQRAPRLTVKSPPVAGEVFFADRIPAEETQNLSLSKRIRAWLAAFWVFCIENPGWGVSIALHSIVVFIIGIWAIQREIDIRALGVTSRFGDHEEASEFDNIGVAAAIEFQSGEQKLTSIKSLTEGGGDGEFTGDATDLLGGTGGGTKGAGDGDSGDLDPGLGASFFGTQGAGRTFVFIVDMSGSMYGARFDRARKELISAINKLNSEQRFFIYFFSDQTMPLFHPKPPRELVSASRNNKDKAKRWIQKVEPGGLTNPALSIRAALEFKPDVIFLLTDGEFDHVADLRELIKKENKRTTIHTIAFEDESGAAALESIATENKGSFRFVP